MKVLIIGGVAGGATAAARLRRLDESAEIVILERSGYVSYANCGLPYYIGGVIEKKQALTLQTKESFWNRFHIDVRLKNEALSIDREKKTVRVKRLSDGSEYDEPYDKLILSPGAKALRPSLPGIDNRRIFTLRTVEDTFAIREQIEQTKPETAVVIGGGFIGLEMAENLVHAGVKTTLLQRGDQVMAPLDYDMACQLHSYLRGRGVDLRLRQTVTGFYEEDGRLWPQ
ncbi:MAG: FAD-dependent oxidoreductase, partial [Clostridium sp.]|nr:FAD-dependent oxidoreductase [Clostridium sp.]